MADSKITALTALTAADPVNDMFPVVDVSDTTMAASGTTKKISVNNILGASGTATLASATITGAATVGTTLGVTGNLTVLSTGLIVNTTGVGVGVTPTNTFHVKGPSGSTTIKIESITDGSLGFIGAASGMISGSPANNLAIRAENGLYLSGGGNATQFILNSAGNVTVSNGNVILGTSGKGIDFSATTSGSGTMTSELLNDYEEGTFTPTIVGSTTAGTGTYSNQSGIYTKVGRQVTVQIYLTWSAHTGTGNIFVGNLPFTNASNYWSASVGYLNNIALTAGSVMTAFVEISASYITLWQYPTGGGAATEVPIDATGGIMLSASYNV
jgi:hypothetical protein